MKTRLVMILGLGILAGAGTPAGAEDIDKDFHQSFEVSRGSTLHLSHGDGEVEIIPWNKDVIDVNVRYKAEISRIGFGGEIGFDVDFRVTGKTVHVVGRERSGATIGILYKNVAEHRYTIRAPSHVALDLEGDDGDVTVEDWNADIECKLDDGDVRLASVKGDRIEIDVEDGDADLSDIEGDLFVEGDDGDVRVSGGTFGRVRIHIEDGDVRLRDCRGDFEIDLDDGDVILQRARAGAAMIRTSDGDVDLHLMSAEDVDVSTDDGSVEIGLADGVSVAFSLRTHDGYIEVDLPDVESLKEREHEVLGAWNSGRGRLQVSTHDGDILLRTNR